MRYADGFVIAVPKKNIAAYRRMSKKAGKIWKKYGALEYCECVGDDLKVTWGVAFPRMAKTKPSETVVFSWIVYTSKRDRDRVNKMVMSDRTIANIMKEPAIFDVKRMAYGGFKIIVDM